VIPGEQCDDEDLDNGDGSSSTCQMEAGCMCTLGTPDVCESKCWDGIKVGPIECDYNYLDDDDGCDSNIHVLE
jgi:cysteine-rich repeat protein